MTAPPPKPWPDSDPRLDALAKLTTVEQIARERGVEQSSLGYRSRAKTKVVA